MSGEFVALFAVALVMLTFWLSLYVYALLAVGRWCAARWRTRLDKWEATAVFALAALLLALPLILIQVEVIYKLTLVFAVWLIHTHSVSMGYWMAFDALRKQDEERWAHNAEEWIAEFEEPVPSFMRDLESDE